MSEYGGVFTDSNGNEYTEAGQYVIGVIAGSNGQTTVSHDIDFDNDFYFPESRTQDDMNNVYKDKYQPELTISEIKYQGVGTKELWKYPKFFNNQAKIILDSPLFKSVSVTYYELSNDLDRVLRNARDSKNHGFISQAQYNELVSDYASARLDITFNKVKSAYYLADGSPISDDILIDVARDFWQDNFKTALTNEQYDQSAERVKDETDTRIETDCCVLVCCEPEKYKMIGE